VLLTEIAEEGVDEDPLEIAHLVCGGFPVSSVQVPQHPGPCVAGEEAADMGTVPPASLIGGNALSVAERGIDDGREDRVRSCGKVQHAL
jgi:hypothetical protein